MLYPSDFAMLHQLWEWWTDRSPAFRALTGLTVVAGFSLWWLFHPQDWGSSIGIGFGGLLILTALFDG